MKDFEKLFTESFVKRIAKYGYNRKRATYIYRKTDLGNCGVELGFTKRLYGYDMRVHLLVRFDRVEELVGQFPPNKFWKEISTISTELGTYINGEIKTWSVRLQADEELGKIFITVLEDIGLPKTDLVSDIENVLDEIVESIEIFGLPFLDKYCNSLEDALSVVAKDDSEASSICHSINARAKTAITIAYLLNDKHAFREIAAKKERLLQRESHFDLHNFRELRGFLETLQNSRI